MMTGDSASWIEEKAREEGINYFLKKPFSQNVIEFVLDRFSLHKT
jgi:hypothetical protein